MDQLKYDLVLNGVIVFDPVGIHGTVTFYRAVKIQDLLYKSVDQFAIQIALIKFFQIDRGGNVHSRGLYEQTLLYFSVIFDCRILCCLSPSFQFLIHFLFDSANKLLIFHVFSLLLRVHLKLK